MEGLLPRGAAPSSRLSSLSYSCPHPPSLSRSLASAHASLPRQGSRPRPGPHLRSRCLVAATNEACVRPRVATSARFSPGWRQLSRGSPLRRAPRSSNRGTCTVASTVPRASSAPPQELDHAGGLLSTDSDRAEESSPLVYPQVTDPEAPPAFQWSKHWYPVALLQDLDPKTPAPFTLLGKDMVLWRDAQGVWRAHRDLCPHRLAPLSEGRIEATGDLQCSYHGWTFRGDGTCSGIPQADTSGPEGRAASSPRACVATFPTTASQGMLFVWPEEGNWAEALGKEPPKLPAAFENPDMFSTVTIQRDLFYGYDVLMENVADPSHIDFAHHSVTGRRDRAKPLPFEVSSLGSWGFWAVAPGNPSITTYFLPPCGAFSKLEFEFDIPLVGQRHVELWICSFNIPMVPGKTRSIVCSARNFARITVPGEQWWAVYPRWLEHLTSNKIYDGDMIVLQGQEKALLRQAGAGGKSYGGLTFTPTAADRVVLAFRNWLRRFGAGGPKWDASCYSDNDPAPLPSTVLSKREMLDRLSQHTEKCSSCKGAYEGIKKWTLALWGFAAVLLAFATVPAEVYLRAALAVAALVALVAGSYLKLVLEPQFVFVDYVHSEIP